MPIQLSFDWQFWMVAIKHENVDDYITDLEKYTDTYVIGLEIAKGVHKMTNGEHIHIAAKMSKEQYDKLHDNIHKKKLKLLLKGTPESGGKQVGRVNNIRDGARLMSYSLKDEKIKYKNIDLITIQEYIKQSFPKGETWDEQLHSYLKNNYEIPDREGYVDWKDCLSPTAYYDTAPMVNLIIEYYKLNSKQKAVPVTSYVRKIIMRFLLYELNAVQQISTMLNI